MGQRDKDFDSIETHFVIENFHEREARNVRERSEQDASVECEALGSVVTENASTKHEARGSERPRM